VTTSKFMIAKSILTACILGVFCTASFADPATFRIKSGDPDVAVRVTHYSINSCYQGPAKTLNNQDVTWDVPKDGLATLNVGQNSAVSGCIGEICVTFSPAEEGRQYQCFVIHGGGGVAPNPDHTPALHPKMSYNSGSWDPATQIYTTRKLPRKIHEIASADTLYTTGTWKRVCSPTGKCSMSSVNRILISDTLANSMTDELETAIASTISNTVTVGVESSSPVSKVEAKNELSVSVTASIRKAVSNTKSRSQGKETSLEDTLTCEYSLPAGNFGYVYQTTVRIGGESITHNTCDFACGNEIVPTFASGSVEHLNSCSG
jgi:hypothetical protein